MQYLLELHLPLTGCCVEQWVSVLHFAHVPEGQYVPVSQSLTSEQVQPGSPGQPAEEFDNSRVIAKRINNQFFPMLIKSKNLANLLNEIILIAELEFNKKEFQNA